MKPDGIDPGSFRDPSGFVFHRHGRLLRQVNLSYRENYDLLLASGLYQTLADRQLLVEHAEAADEEPATPEAYKILRPRRVEFITYPYEWCFSQLKDAALATLEAQRIALEHGMVLKDASAYNIQFPAGKPILIDTLSFERWADGRPWAAYRQFCQHFLAPLAVMSHRRSDLRRLLIGDLDGLPLDVASRLLSRATWLRPGLLIHLHLHARSQRRYASSARPTSPRPLTRHQMLALVDSLRSAVERLTWKAEGTAWADYYSETTYSAEEQKTKARVVDTFVEAMAPGAVLDLGANTGRYSQIAAGRGRFVVACDMDPAAVERNYRECAGAGETRILHVVLDLTNPSPALGWDSRERASWIERFSGHNLLALALLHHLAIGNNLPLGRISRFLARLGDELVIEFVPKSDPQVQRLLASRDDIFPDYSREGFEAAFGEDWETLATEKVSSSGRRLYRMRRRR